MVRNAKDAMQKVLIQTAQTEEQSGGPKLGKTDRLSRPTARQKQLLAIALMLLGEMIRHAMRLADISMS